MLKFQEGTITFVVQLIGLNRERIIFILPKFEFNIICYLNRDLRKIIDNQTTF